MNAEDALAAIRDARRPGDKERKDDDRRGQKRECPNRRTNDGIRRKDDKGPQTIKELIKKGKLQKFVKKGEFSRFWDGNKGQHESSFGGSDRQFQPPKNVIGEIQTIAGGPIAGGSFKSLKKAYQRQVNSVYMTPPLKHRRTDQDMIFNEGDARGVKQPHNDPLVIALTIEGFNTKRILVDNGSSADIIYFLAFQ
nr:uncharacterized protein LOC112010442 [Quercus suber]